MTVATVEGSMRPLFRRSEEVCTMPMRLEGSCRCGAMSFSVDSHTPYPYQRCYCSICRKSAGGGGYAINIMGLADTLKVKGSATAHPGIDRQGCAPIPDLGPGRSGGRNRVASGQSKLSLFTESDPKATSAAPYDILGEGK